MLGRRGGSDSLKHHLYDERSIGCPSGPTEKLRLRSFSVREGPDEHAQDARMTRIGRERLVSA